VKEKQTNAWDYVSLIHLKVTFIC